MLEYRRWLAAVALCALSWACGGDDDDGGSTADASTAADARAPDAGGEADASNADASGGADASGAACGGIPVEPLGPSGIAEGSIAAGEGQLASPGCGGDGAEVVYALTIDETTSLELALETSGLDAVVSVRRDCLDDASEVGCAAAPFESLIVGPLDPGTYYVVVDGATAEASGDFTVSAQPPSEGQSCDEAFIVPPPDFGTLVDRQDVRSSCAPISAAAENVYELPVPVLSSLTVHAVGLGIAAAPTISVRTGDCADPAAEVACFPGDPGQPIDDPPPGPYFVVVEGADALPFGLTATGTIPIGSPCIPFDPRFVCEPGSGCGFADRVCAVHTCSDGIDNDENGRTDYPDDPGCSFAGDDAEDADCPGPSCPACGNGVDDDGDGRIDFPADTDCMSASQFVETTFTCENDLDDDGDGLVDGVDPGCFDPSTDDSEVDTCPEGPGCPVCSDGIDNDGDGLIDWPVEPGCREPDSIDEIDPCPDPGLCPGCSNGRDDDDDGLVDYPEDLDCPTAYSFERLDCRESDPYVLVTGPIMTGTTVGATNDRALELLRACYDDEQEFDAPDVVLWLPLPGLLSYLRVDSSGSDFEAIVGIGENSCSLILSCEQGPQETEVTAGGFGAFAYIHVDGGFGAAGNYVLEIEGEIFAGEACDQGQIDAGILHCQAPTLCVEGICQ